MLILLFRAQMTQELAATRTKPMTALSHMEIRQVSQVTLCSLGISRLKLPKTSLGRSLASTVVSLGFVYLQTLKAVTRKALATFNLDRSKKLK